MTKQPQTLTPRGGGKKASLLLGLILSLFLCQTGPVYPETEGKTTFWEQHGKVEDESTAPTFSPRTRMEIPDEPVPLTLENLRIPVEHGSLKKSHSAREPIIIHIQDAHANYVAQKHLSGILEYLILAHDLSLVLVEGGSRNDSLSYMRTYAPLEKRKKVAEEFLKSGKISGENYLDLTTDYDFTVYGIERPELYDRNMEAFFTVEQVQPKALTAIEGFRKAVDALKNKLYPDQVKVLELREGEVKDGRIPLAKHYEALDTEAQDRSIQWEEEEFPNLHKFLEASRRETELNFRTVEVERGKFLDALTGTLPQEKMDKLLKQSLELKGGLVTPATFYGHLQKYMKPEQRVVYPALYSYMTYLELFEGINHAALFTEVEGFTEKIKTSYFSDKDQQQLFQVAKDVEILGDLLELKLTPDTYNYYRSNKREFKPDRWAKILRDLGEDQSPVQRFPLSPGPLSAAMPAMAGFYEVARDRDKAMVDNALKQIKEFDVPFAVLIAGGFHTPAFERLFQEEHVSYAVVAPKVGKVTAADTEKYHRVLKETYVPMSEKYREKMGIQPVTNNLRAQNQRKSTRASASEFRPVSLDETKLAAFIINPEE